MSVNIFASHLKEGPQGRNRKVRSRIVTVLSGIIHVTRRLPCIETERPLQSTCSTAVTSY